MTNTPPRTILALDMAASCGWAFASDGVITAWGVEDFRLRSDDRFASGHRLRRFYNWLNDFGGVSEVYYEISGIPAGSGARNRSVASNEVQIQLKGILSMFCACYRIPMTGMHNATLKKSFTGYGRADKEDMCRFAHNLGWPGGVPGTAMDHDAADAIALIVCIEKENGNAVRFAK